MRSGRRGRRCVLGGSRYRGTRQRHESSQGQGSSLHGSTLIFWVEKSISRLAPTEFLKFIRLARAGNCSRLRVSAWPSSINGCRLHIVRIQNESHVSRHFVETAPSITATMPSEDLGPLLCGAVSSQTHTAIEKAVLPTSTQKINTACRPERKSLQRS